MNRELANIIILHANRYPKAQVQDFVKLIYQNTFMSGHMISNEDAVFERLLIEFDSLDLAFYADCPRYEPIGEGVYRANIARFERCELKRLSEAFIRTANNIVISPPLYDEYKEKLQGLIDMFISGEITADIDKAREFISAHIKSGCEALHHSGAYVEAYKPAYRIISEELCF